MLSISDSCEVSSSLASLPLVCSVTTSAAVSAGPVTRDAAFEPRDSSAYGIVSPHVGIAGKHVASNPRPRKSGSLSQVSPLAKMLLLLGLAHGTDGTKPDYDGRLENGNSACWGEGSRRDEFLSSLIFTCHEGKQMVHPFQAAAIKHHLKDFGPECVDLRVHRIYDKYDSYDFGLYSPRKTCGPVFNSCASVDELAAAFSQALTPQCGVIVDDRHGAWQLCDTSGSNCRRLFADSAMIWRTALEKSIFYFPKSYPKADAICHNLCLCTPEWFRVQCGWGVWRYNQAIDRGCGEFKHFDFECSSWVDLDEAIQNLDDSGRIKHCFSTHCDYVHMVGGENPKACWSYESCTDDKAPPLTEADELSTTTGPASSAVSINPPEHPLAPSCWVPKTASFLESFVYKCDPDTGKPALVVERVDEIREQLFRLWWDECVDVVVKVGDDKSSPQCGEPISTCLSDSETLAKFLSPECGRTVTLTDGRSAGLWLTCPKDINSTASCRDLVLTDHEAWRLPVEDQVMYFGRKVDRSCELCQCDFESKRMDCRDAEDAFNSELAKACAARYNGTVHCRVSELDMHRALRGDKTLEYCFESDCETFQVGKGTVKWLEELSSTYKNDSHKTEGGAVVTEEYDYTFPAAQHTTVTTAHGGVTAPRFNYNSMNYTDFLPYVEEGISHGYHTTATLPTEAAADAWWQNPWSVVGGLAGVALTTAALASLFTFLKRKAEERVAYGRLAEQRNAVDAISMRGLADDVESIVEMPAEAVADYDEVDLL